MNPIDYKLLSVLKTGETLRIVLSRPSGREPFGVHLEAVGLLGKTSPDLTRRVSILLDALRKQGIAYELAQGRPPDSHLGLARVTIVPRSRDLHAAPDGRLGFGGETRAGTATDTRVRVPALSAMPAPDLVSYAIEFLDRDKQVHAVQLSFTRTELDARWDNLLNRSLDMKFSALVSLIDRKAEVNSMQRFLALWLVRKIGWTIDLTATVRNARSMPRSALEMIGREIYDTECEVRTGGPSTKERAPDLDLGTSYPDGWIFPNLLPPPEMMERMDLDRRHNRSLPVLPTQGILIGKADNEPVHLPNSVRDRHLYVIGATGTGKSTLLARMIDLDLAAGESVVLLDPHGDLFSDIHCAVPAHRRAEVIAIDPNSHTAPIPFNVLDVPRDELFGRRVDFVISELISFFHATWNLPEAFGPMFEVYFRNTIQLMMFQPETRLSLADFENVMTDSSLRAELCSTCERPDVVRFWKKTAGEARGETSLANIVPYIVSKLSPMLQSEFLGKMLGAKRDELAIDRRLNAPCIILVNLNKGMLGSRGSSLLGSLLTMNIFAAGLKRSLMPAAQRRPVNVYIDEFQNFVSDNVASMFSEARKFGLRMHVANQHLGQLTQDRGRGSVAEAILGNVGNLILFRLGVLDAGRLQPFYRPFTRAQMQELPNYHALTRLLNPTGPIRPFVMQTIHRPTR